MKKSKDAYGQEVWAHFQGRNAYEIIERDDGFVGSSGGPKEYFAGYKDWSKWQKRAIKFAKGKVLDVGCGAGRVALYLQQKRCDVTAIDTSPLAVKVCKLRGVKKAKVMSLEEAVNKFHHNTFDSVIMFGANFGLFGNYHKAKNLLQKLYQITSHNAVIVAESNDPYKTDNLTHLAYHRRNKQRGRMSGQIRMRIRFDKYKGDWFDYLLVSKKEMKDIVEGTGWKIKRFIDSGKYMYIAVIGKEAEN